MKKTKRLVLLAMLTAVAMILSYVESLLPQIGIPGVKMGLANIAVIFALFRFGWKEAAALSLVRVLLVIEGCGNRLELERHVGEAHRPGGGFQ